MMFSHKSLPFGQCCLITNPPIGQWCLITNPLPWAMMFGHKSPPLGHDVWSQILVTWLLITHPLPWAIFVHKSPFLGNDVWSQFPALGQCLITNPCLWPMMFDHKSLSFGQCYLITNLQPWAMMFDDKSLPLVNDAWSQIHALRQWCFITNPHPRAMMFDKKKKTPLGNVWSQIPALGQWSFVTNPCHLGLSVLLVFYISTLYVLHCTAETLHHHYFACVCYPHVLDHIIISGIGKVKCRLDVALYQECQISIRQGIIY